MTNSNIASKARHSLLLAATLASAALMPAGLRADNVQLNNGDTLTGTIHTLGKQHITLQSPLASTPLDIKAASVRKITFSATQEKHPAHTELLTLANNDILPCTVLSMDAKHLHIHTWYAGDFHIPRTSIRSLLFGIGTEKTAFLGNQPPAQWPTHKGDWHFAGGTYRTGKTGTLAANPGLPENVRFRFNLAWKQTPNFAFRFCAANNSANTKQDTYELLFNSAGIQISRYQGTSRHPARLASIPALKPDNIENRNIDIDIRLNRTDGLLSLYADTTLVGTWADPMARAKGNYIIFNNRTNREDSCIISNIQVTGLNDGALPRHRENILPKGTDILLDSEGNKLSGTLTSITKADPDKRTVTLNLKHAPKPLQVPDRRISTLLFAQPEKTTTFPHPTFTALLTSGGKLQLTTPKLANGKITSTHPILGTCTLTPKAVSHINKNNPDKKTTQPANRPATPTARIFLSNGDKLTGTPQTLDTTSHLHFTSPSLGQPATFPLASILTLHLSQQEKHTPPQNVTRVELQPRFHEARGDTIIGKLAELTPETVKLETQHGGTIGIKRSMVKSLKIISNAPGNYHGPNGLHEWSPSGGKNAWYFSQGALVSRAAGGIGKDIRLREKAHISFDAKWQDSMRFKLRLYSSDVTKTRPNAYYEININQYHAYMNTQGKRRRGARMFGGGGGQINVRPTEPHAHFDLFANRKTGAVTIYINGTRACALQSHNPDPLDLGTGLSFHAEERFPLEISGITVTPWDGTTFPTPKKKTPATSPTPGGKKPPHRIILNNGDQVPGTVGKVTDGHMLVDTEYTPIRIPVSRIKSLDLGNSDDRPKKYRGDVRAWLHTGGFITLKLTSLTNTQLQGYSQPLGNVTFNLTAFNRIDFHIYNPKANQTRQKIQF